MAGRATATMTVSMMEMKLVAIREANARMKESDLRREIGSYSSTIMLRMVEVEEVSAGFPILAIWCLVSWSSDSMVLGSAISK